MSDIKPDRVWIAVHVVISGVILGIAASAHVNMFGHSKEEASSLFVGYMLGWIVRALR